MHHENDARLGRGARALFLILAISLVVTMALIFWDWRRGPGRMFEDLHAVLDRAAVPESARLISEEVTGSVVSLGGPDPPTVTRVYVSTQTPGALCEELDDVLRPLGPVVGTTSKSDGTISFTSGTECIITGTVEPDTDLGFGGHVRSADSYRQFLAFSDETAYLIPKIDATALSVLLLDASR